MEQQEADEYKRRIIMEGTRAPGVLHERQIKPMLDIFFRDVDFHRLDEVHIAPIHFWNAAYGINSHFNLENEGGQMRFRVAIHRISSAFGSESLREILRTDPVATSSLIKQADHENFSEALRNIIQERGKEGAAKNMMSNPAAFAVMIGDRISKMPKATKTPKPGQQEFNFD